MKPEQKFAEWSHASHVQRELGTDHEGGDIGIVAVVATKIRGEPEGPIEVECGSYTPTCRHACRLGCSSHIQLQSDLRAHRGFWWPLRRQCRCLHLHGRSQAHVAHGTRGSI